MHWIWTLLNYNMRILQVAFLLLFKYPISHVWCVLCDGNASGLLSMPLRNGSVTFWSAMRHFYKGYGHWKVYSWRVDNLVPVHYCVIWNRVQLFGDYNIQVCVVHECVIITKKLHSIPYDTVTHWNEVINTYLHRQLTCYFYTLFPHQR